MKINGSLAFDASSASEITNLRVEKLASLPSFVPGADQGRLVYITGNQSVYYGDADSWVPLATGGNAFSQTEGDAIETTLGAAINGDGTLNAAAFSSPIATASSFTDAINQLAAYATGNNTLAELDDVDLTGNASGSYLKYNGTMWVPDVLTVSDVTDLTVSAAQINNAAATTSSTAELNILDGATVTAAELNILDGATLTTAELNFVDGVTSGIQDQLDNKQALDAGLTALAAFNTNGYLVQTADNVWAGRTMQAPAAGLTISNPDGVAGNSAFALANDLAALEGLATTGIVVRTGDGTATTRAISGNTGRIVVTDGSGVSGEPNIDLATVTQGASGTFSKITLDSYGRVSGNTPVVVGDITALVDTVYVNLSGDTMTGDLNMGTNYVTMNNVPTLGTQAANKAYVDAAVQGLSWKQAVHVKAVGNVTIATPGASIDSHALVAGDRVLLTDQTTGSENGIYVFDTASTPLVRAVDADAFGELNGAAVFVQVGATYADSGWTQTATLSSFSGQSWAQFSGSSTYIWGTGLASSGNTIFVNLGAGIVELPSDEIGLDIVANKAIQLDALTSGGKLTFVLDTGSGLEQSATGLKISANGVTNAMILNDAHPATADSGSGSLDLGDTLHIVGVSTQGTSVSVNETVPGVVQYIVTAADASASQKGVASFSSADFTVTAGAVSIASISNGQLDNSSITVTGTTGSDAVALGESFAIVGGSAPITTVSAANSVTISVADADTTNKGLASFNTDHFSVTAGAVSLAATLDDLTNVSSADSATTGHVLVKGVGDWAPVSPATLAGTMLLGDLQDVGTAAPSTAGQALIADGTAWQATKIYHLHTQSSSATTWTVTHGLGQKYCVVTIVDNTDNVVIPQSIVFDSTTALTVTFNTTLTGKVVVMGIA